MYKRTIYAVVWSGTGVSRYTYESKKLAEQHAKKANARYKESLSTMARFRLWLTGLPTPKYYVQEMQLSCRNKTAPHIVAAKMLLAIKEVCSKTKEFDAFDITVPVHVYKVLCAALPGQIFEIEEEAPERDDYTDIVAVIARDKDAYEAHEKDR